MKRQERCCKADDLNLNGLMQLVEGNNAPLEKGVSELQSLPTQDISTKTVFSDGVEEEGSFIQNRESDSNSIQKEFSDGE